MYFYNQILWKALQTSFSPKYFHPLHATYVSIFVSLFLTLKNLVSLVRLADRVCYPQYRQQVITAPIYITGNPRSGTTYLHRLLCEDPQFTYTKLYHTIFPSLSFYQIFQQLENLNNKLDGLFTPIVDWLDKKGFSGWEKIHTTKLNQAEEDEQFFVFTMLSPVITLLFPFFEELKESCWVDELPKTTRQKLMLHYRDCLKRHLYAIAPEKTLLIKNTTSTGRLQSMLETIPDMRVIHIIRHPYESIPSLLSMYNASWKTFVPQTRNNSDASWGLAQLYAQYYRQRLNIFQEFKSNHQERFLEVRYEDLISYPFKIVEEIYDKFQLTQDEQVLSNLKAKIQNSQRNYKSQHKYSLEQFGLTKEMLYEVMKDVFDAYDFER